EQYLGMLHYWLARAQPAAADDVGSGALRLFGFGCPAITPAEGPRCRDAFTLVFSAIGQGAVEPFRYQVIFVIEQPAGTSTLGITETLLAGSMALGEEFDVVQHGGALDLADFHGYTCFAVLPGCGTSGAFFLWNGPPAEP